jgi:diaminopimelate decarboxylase
LDDFVFHNGVLHCETVDLRAVADRFGTPLYVYSQHTLIDHYNKLSAAFAPVSGIICFSVKSCQNLAILKLLKERGSGFDVVSGGELQRALAVGADPAKIAFAGVGKTDDEIRAALDANIGWFNVESQQELDNIASIAERAGKRAVVALRVNPDVDPHTHVYTTTGKRETKFGIDLPLVADVFTRFARRPGLRLAGMHLHLGSPVNTIDPYVQAIHRALDLIDRLTREGHKIEAINIGGGFGAHYQGDEAPAARDYAEQIVPLLRDRGLQVLLETGRSISANAGILLGRVLYTKESGNRRFVIVDAAMTELIRPALYGSYHFAWPVEPREAMIPPSRAKDLHLPGTALVDVVGPVCESGDFLAKDRWLPPVERGDLLAIFSAGAYGMVMSSQYNSRPRAAEVLVDRDGTRLIRRRETFDDLITAERDAL